MLPPWEYCPCSRVGSGVGCLRAVPETADVLMQVLSRRALREFWTSHAHAERPLSAWYKIVYKTKSENPNQIKQQFGNNVDFIGDGRAIFDIGVNKYRLVARIVYAPYYRVMVKFVGTHEEYDEIDPEAV